MSDTATPAAHFDHVSRYYIRQANLAGAFAVQRRLASDHAGYRAAQADEKRFARLAREAA